MSAELEQIDLSISGMTCSSCVATVERALNKVPGAKSAVNLATETAHILVPEGTKAETLIDAVAKAGYSAKLRTDESESFSYSTDLGIRVLLASLLTIPIVVISMWHTAHHQIDEFLVTQLQNLGLPLPLYSATGWLLIGLTAPVVLIIAWPIHRAALRNFVHPTMDNLISIGSMTAFLWSIYANSTGAGDIYAEVAASVVTLITFGRFLESRAKHRAGSALANLLSLNPKEVVILRSGEEVIAPIDHLAVGDFCVVRPGDRIPTDGIVRDGTSAIDTSFITGESLPVDIGVGAEVIAGAINRGGRIVIEARRIGNDTELSRITKMVLTAQTEKAPIQRLADRISGIFVPVVLLLALATFCAWYLLGNPLQESISAAVALLVIACPCALGLATPVALLVATGKGASRGIVLRRAATLEIAPSITTVVLDKTGTLTTGSMAVKSVVIPDLGRNGVGLSHSEILSAVMTMERESSHPIAQAIVRHLLVQGSQRLDFSELMETAGQGLAARIHFGPDRQLPVLIGSPESILRATISFHPDIEAAITDARTEGNSIAIVAIDGIAVAAFVVGDTLRSDSTSAIEAFRKRGIKIWLVTGDALPAATAIGKVVGIDQSNILAQATPAMKIEKVKELRSLHEQILMIGDGVNDAAALAEADLSMAMGTGTDTAISSADITLMRPSLYAALEALDLAKKTLRTIRGNLAWAFIYNVTLMPVAALGLLNPMYAGGAMAMSSLFVVLNSLRLSRAATLAP